MVEGARPALGLSIGATNLAAVTADSAIIRRPVLTLYRRRPPEVGVPSDNPRLDEPGVVINDFVDRVGNPVGIVADDGSVHRSEALVADALRALAYVATGGRPLPENTAVTYPAHWPSKAVDALGAALSRVAEWSDRAHPLLLIPDAAATLLAVRANPGIPARGTVAVCDFGGNGTNITLMHAADQQAPYQALAPTVRHRDFSGDMIDQALLTAVMAAMPSADSFEPSATSPIRSLSRLRAGCRSAKERLSSSTVTTLSDGLTWTHGDIRLTRDELDGAIRESLNNFVEALDELLRRNGIHDLVAVVSAGGGANIPLVTTTLSGHLRVPVVTTPRPQLTAAVGAALRAARGPGNDTAAAMTTPSESVTATAPAVARAWPRTRSAPTARAHAQALNMMPALSGREVHDELRAGPALSSEQSERPEAKRRGGPWYRRPAVAIVSTAVAVLLVGTALGIELRSNDKAPTRGTTLTQASPPPAPSASPQPPPENPPASPSAAPQAAPPDNPPATGDTPPPAAPPAVPDTPGTRAPAPQAPPTPAGNVIPAIPRIPSIPHLPPIPGINEPIPGLAGIPTLASLIAPRGR